MRIVVDTNVFVSGVFFTGPPYAILDAWRRGVVQIVISPDILDEYRRVGDRACRTVLSRQSATGVGSTDGSVDQRSLPPTSAASLPRSGRRQVSCVRHGRRAKVVITGDKALLATSGYANITVLTPREFLDQYLKDQKG